MISPFCTQFPTAVMDSDSSHSLTRQSQSLSEVPADSSVAGPAPGNTLPVNSLGSGLTSDNHSVNIAESTIFYYYYGLSSKT